MAAPDDHNPYASPQSAEAPPTAPLASLAPEPVRPAMPFHVPAGQALGCAMAIVLVGLNELMPELLSKIASPNTWANSAIAGWIVGQISLLAIWAAVGDGSLPVRLACVAPFAGYWFWVYSDMLDSHYPVYEFWLFVIMVALPFVVLRISGREIRRSAELNVDEVKATPSAQPPTRGEFALLQMFGWGSVIVLVVGLLRSRPEIIEMPPGWIVLGASGAAIALASAWLIFRRNRLEFWQAVCLFLAAAALSAGVCRFQFGAQRELFNWTMVVVEIDTALVLAGLFLFRRIGYRLVRTGDDSTNDPLTDGELAIVDAEAADHEAAVDSHEGSRLPEPWSDYWSRLRMLAPPLGLLLIAVFLLLDLLRLVAYLSSGQIGLSGRGSFAATQVNLLVVWAAMGRTRAQWRWPLAIAGIFVIIWLYPYGFGFSIAYRSAMEFGEAIACCAVVLAVARLLGLRLVRIGEPEEWFDGAARTTPWRSLRLVVFLSILGILIFMGAIKAATGSKLTDFQTTLTLAIIVPIQGFIMALETWVALGRPRALVRLVVLVVVVGLPAAISASEFSFDRFYFWTSIYMGLVRPAALIGPLLVFRVCGYRLQRRSRFVAECRLAAMERLR